MDAQVQMFDFSHMHVLYNVAILESCNLKASASSGNCCRVDIDIVVILIIQFQLPQNREYSGMPYFEALVNTCMTTLLFSPQEHPDHAQAVVK